MSKQENISRHEWLEKVIDLGKTVAEVTDLQTCLLTIHRSIRDGLGFDRVGIFLFIPEQNMVQGTYGTDRAGKLWDESHLTFSVAEDRSFFDVVNHPKGFVHSPNYSVKYHVPVTDTMYGVEDHAIVGAWAGDKPIAVLAVDNLISKKKITEAQLEALRLFAGYAGLAIHNAQLYEAVQEEIAERRQAEAALQAAFDRLKELDQLKDGFINHLSHELRTPITILKLKCYLLETHPDRLEDSLEEIKQATRRLEALIEDMLYASRIEHELREVALSTVELNRLVDQIAAKYGPIANERGIELILKQEDILPKIKGHAILLKRALSNILTNAVNYSYEGDQIIVTTGVESNRDKQQVYLQISDTGLGISSEELPYIFDRFYRGKIAVESHKPGAGLGLYIAREIINRHAGQLEVQSEGVSRKGCTFTIRLPIPEA
jgi:signal transduction histidine kinase